MTCDFKYFQTSLIESFYAKLNSFLNVCFQNKNLLNGTLNAWQKNEYIYVK